MQAEILVLEDDGVLNGMIGYHLSRAGYAVTAARTLAEATAALAEKTFAMALLDVNLPDGDGFAFCRTLKAAQPAAMVLFLTANDEEAAQLHGYDLGAVDYITKPFYIGALVRKVQALLAMAAQAAPLRHVVDDGHLVLDFDGQTAAYDGKPLRFTAMEFKVLALFCQHPRQVLTRRQLLEKLWDCEARFVEEHTLTATVSRIRGKLDSVGGQDYIKTVYGLGYQWMGGGAACVPKNGQ